MSRGSTRREKPHSLRAIAMSLVLSVCLPLSAGAQRYEFVGETEIAHFAGGVSAADIIPSGEHTALEGRGVYPELRMTSLSVHDGFAVGLRLSRNIRHRWTVEASWSYAFSELLRTDGSAGQENRTRFDRLGIIQYEVGLLFYPAWLYEERFGPFIRVGGGGVSWRPANDFPFEVRPVATKRTASLAGVVGAGVTFYATQDLSLRAEYAASATRVDRAALLGLVYPFPEIASRTVTLQRIEVGFTLRLFDTEL